MHLLHALSKGILPSIYCSLTYKMLDFFHNINVLSQQVTQNNHRLEEHA